MSECWYSVQTFMYSELRDAFVDEAEKRGFNCWRNYPWTDEASERAGGFSSWSTHIGYFGSDDEMQAAVKESLDAAYKTFNKLMIEKGKQ